MSLTDNWIIADIMVPLIRLVQRKVLLCFFVKSVRTDFAVVWLALLKRKAVNCLVKNRRVCIAFLV